MAYDNDYLDGGADLDVVNLWAHRDDHDTLPGGAGVDVVITSVTRGDGMRGTGTVNFLSSGPETATFVNFEPVWTREGRDTFDASGAQMAA